MSERHLNTGCRCLEGFRGQDFVDSLDFLDEYRGYSRSFMFVNVVVI